MSSSAEPVVPTASQTVGPFFEIGLSHLRRDQVVDARPGDSPIVVRGCVRDGNGAAVPDVALEVWQAAPDGTFDLSGSRGFARIHPDDAGDFAFRTVVPGRVPGPGAALQAPHLVVTLLMRGLLKPLRTRLYFPGDPANDTDLVLSLIPADRRATLIARTGADDRSLCWDVVLQGANETVFFEW